MSRADSRKNDELRPLELIPDWLENAHGSVLYSQGKTRVLCTAMVEEGVPRWLHRSGRGWMKARCPRARRSTTHPRWPPVWRPLTPAGSRIAT